MCLTGIFDYLEVILPRNFQDGLHIGGQAVEVNRQHRDYWSAGVAIDHVIAVPGIALFF